MRHGSQGQPKGSSWNPWDWWDKEKASDGDFVFDRPDNTGVGIGGTVKQRQQNWDNLTQFYRENGDAPLQSGLLNYQTTSPRNGASQQVGASLESRSDSRQQPLTRYSQLASPSIYSGSGAGMNVRRFEDGGGLEPNDPRVQTTSINNRIGGHTQIDQSGNVAAVATPYMSNRDFTQPVQSGLAVPDVLSQEELRRRQMGQLVNGGGQRRG